ncbi:5-dehydro-4-deoxyglucarate dehydratase [Flavilitoribacter nigricans]|uniref:Probable 5-dehydro-4-deoxyglucarate dehydratase n=1 Tax=Flavilitoribacter nigricans (strain ATCC 23147 / DSM 23189 / NBRC 102662 / NCIMB 1420 / SS-2) TaxID=1122177 RepID=A0A2D0NA79_FLAN2|nr:5-dehydro-4-deoxyglucarate dehydratase [Flavilitoribacter nigricans]PHN05288.1 5-dehydro-4-deoxyglucarate dehydratase [Flavilitoribacter nigricans DSM 23189 = NBRC 102662]
MPLPISQIRAALEDGLLSFPVTDMDHQGRFRADTYADRIEWFVSQGVSAVFVAGGTGEFFSLSAEEYTQVVQTATQTVAGKVPVISSAGRSIPEAIAFAKIAEKAGIDALLLMPPYLTDAPQSGIFQYARTILENTSLPVIYYNRSNGVLSADYIRQLADACPNLIGIKDGTSNMQELNMIIRTVGDRLSYIGGAPTAEIISEAYLSIGVNTYSSAVFNFVPELANLFYASMRAGDTATVTSILQTFFIPFIQLRSRNKGYAVSLIKAGARIIGKEAGDVRAPLVMPTAAEVSELERIIQNGLQLLQ